MPTYDYKCMKCGYRFDKFQRITDDQQQYCPACGSPAKRLISKGAGIIFKGGGFYITDYAKKNSIT